MTCTGVEDSFNMFLETEVFSTKQNILNIKDNNEAQNVQHQQKCRYSDVFVCVLLFFIARIFFFTILVSLFLSAEISTTAQEPMAPVLSQLFENSSICIRCPGKRLQHIANNQLHFSIYLIL